MRKSKLLIRYLKQFNIKINTSQLTLYGDERVIRITLYALIWMSSQGTNLPKAKERPINYERIIETISPYFPDSHSYSAQRQITLMLDIIYLRIQSGNGLIDKVTIDSYIPLNKTLGEYCFKDWIKDTNMLEAEIQFAGYLLIATPNFLELMMTG